MADVAPRPLGEAFRADPRKATVAAGGRVRVVNDPTLDFDVAYVPTGRRRFGVVINQNGATALDEALALGHHMLAHERFDIEVWKDGRPARCEHHRADVLWALAFLHPAWSNAAIVAEYYRLERQTRRLTALPPQGYHPAAGHGSAG